MFQKYSKPITKWAFRAYVVWSICADIIVLSGVVYLLLR